MTARTRRRLMICVVLGLITLPVEMLLLPVATTPNARQAAEQWVATLSGSELNTATARIADYPAEYRKALMSGLSTEDRARVWRGQFEKYMTAHPELTADQVAIIREAMSLVTAESFQPPLKADLQARITSVFDRATKELPAGAAKELFVTLGPNDPGQANALPLSVRLADKIRAWRVAQANGDDCWCNTDWDTCDVWPEPDWLDCSENYYCIMDLEWPMCGPLWSWACNGWCRLILN